VEAVAIEKKRLAIFKLPIRCKFVTRAEFEKEGLIGGPKPKPVDANAPVLVETVIEAEETAEALVEATEE